MPHRKSGCRWGQGRPAGLSIAKSADAENAGATQHSPKQRPQSARSTSCARSGASPEGPGSLLKGGLRPGWRRFAARLRPGQRLPGAPDWPRLRSGHYDRQQPWRRDRGQVMTSSVPVIDLTPWFGGDQEARAAVAAKVDTALQRETKQRYAVTVAGRGWLPPGVEADGYAEGTATPPDLKESFAVGADQPTGDPEIDGYWFQPNV